MNAASPERPALSAATNPFRSQRVTTLPYQPQGKHWEALLQDLEAMQWRGAVIGPCGTGKTTLLEKLEPELAVRGFQVHFLRLNASHRQLPNDFCKLDLGSHDAVLFDGAEQVPPWVWRRFQVRTRRAGALILTSHREGRIPTWLRSSTSPALLSQICADLGAPLPDAEIRRVFEAHGGNLRLCLMEFYDLAARSFENCP